MADNFYGPEDMAEYYRMTKPNILTDGLYVARDGNLAKMETKYILPKGATVCWVSGNPTNADRIRAMTIPELAFALMHPCDFSDHIPSEWCKNRNCGYQCKLDWLKQEATDEHP